MADHDDTNASRTEHDSTTEEKKQCQTTEEAQIEDENVITSDGIDSGPLAAKDGDYGDATGEEEGDAGIVYLHGLRFNLIAIWYVKAL